MILKNNLLTISLILLVLSSCSQTTSSSPSSSWQMIAARDEGQPSSRAFIYRALVPSNWIRLDPSATESIADTTKSICEFYIQDHDQTIRVTIHTFPITQSQHRIPPQAQIARWKKQFDELDPLTTRVIPESHGGFSGLYFEGEGLLKGQPTKILGWSMQLANCYERQLHQEKQFLDSCKRADYTIKASGSPLFIDQHRLAILAFAHSFELIDELPSPL